jgi:pimeloyl-ACP methyl ester carboxylesterase
MDTVEVGGLRLAYQRAGRGPSLVLFHGVGEDSRSWRLQLEGLSDEFRGYPEIPASLVLASAYAGWAGSLPSAEVERRYAQVESDINQPPERFINQWLPTLFTDKSDPNVIAETTRIMADVRPSGMRVLLSASGRADYRPVLPTINIPKLLLYGADDQRSPLDVARGLHRQIPGSRLVVLPDVGHLSFAEAPQAFNAEVRNFLHGIDTK